MGENFISLHPWCAVISEWNNTDDEEPRNKSAIVSATGIPYQNNEGPLQRDEVKATFNKEENNDNARKSTTRVGFLLLSHRRAPLVIFHVISTLLSSLSLLPSPRLFHFFALPSLQASKIECRSRTTFFFLSSAFSPFYFSRSFYSRSCSAIFRRGTILSLSTCWRERNKKKKVKNKISIFNDFSSDNFYTQRLTLDWTVRNRTIPRNAEKWTLSIL